MKRFIALTLMFAVAVCLALPNDAARAAGPLGPGCGNYKVLKNETIAGQAFPKGTYLVHAMGISCKKVLGKNGLLVKFLRLPDDAKLPHPWFFLADAIGAPKFSAGPGVGFRVQRISP